MATTSLPILSGSLTASAGFQSVVLAHRDRKGLKETPAPRVRRDRKGCKALKDHRDPKGLEFKVLPVFRDLKVHKADRAPKDRKAHRG